MIPSAIRRALLSSANFPYVYNAKRSNTIGLRDAINSARRGTARKRILHAGDSTTFGTGNSPGAASSNAVESLTYVQQLKALMNAGMCPTKMNTFMGGAALNIADYKVYNSRVTANAAWTMSSGGTHSIGGFLFQCSTSGLQLNWTPGEAFDTAEILFLDPAPTRGILVRANSATVATLSNVGTTNTPRRAVVTGISPATTVLGFQPGNSAAVFLCGVGTYMAGDTSLALYCAGWGGSTVGDWNDSAIIYSAVAAIPALAPDHTFLELDINDENAPTNITTFKTLKQGLIDAAKQSGSVTLVVGGPTAPNPPGGTHTSLATQQSFRQADYDLADANDLSLLDLTMALGSYDEMNLAGYMYDVSHLTANGYGVKAGVYYNYIRQVMALGE